MPAKRSKPQISYSSKICLSRKICELYKQGHTIESSCTAFGIIYNTFQSWAQPKLSQEDIESGNYRRGFVQEVHEIYKRATDVKTENFHLAMKNASDESLLRLILGEEYEEVTKEVKIDADGNAQAVSIRTTIKRILPNAAAVIFTKKQLEPEVWSERIKTEHGTIVIHRNEYEGMSRKELAAEKARLEDKLNSDDDF
jgi:hypothetical protein